VKRKDGDRSSGKMEVKARRGRKAHRKERTRETRGRRKSEKESKQGRKVRKSGQAKSQVEGSEGAKIEKKEEKKETTKILKGGPAGFSRSTVNCQRTLGSRTPATPERADDQDEPHAYLEGR